MLQKTRGIVLRSVRYGESSIITTVFTELFGVQSYMMQGVRSSRASQNRAGFFQPATMLDLVVYHNPQKNLQRIREFQPAYIYTSVQESVIKNSIVLFSMEMLLRLLPDQAPAGSLFDFAFSAMITLDSTPAEEAANMPLFFIVNCSRMLGYELRGSFSADTPYLNLQEGGFTGSAPSAVPYTTDEDALILNTFLRVDDYALLKNIAMNAAMRFRLLHWFIAYLQLHTQHMGSIRSLPILQAILHG